MKKGVLKNYTKFTGKHLCQSIIFNKVEGLRPATLLKKRLSHRCFPVNFAKFLRTPFLNNTPGRLLLTILIHQLIVYLEKMNKRHKIQLVLMINIPSIFVVIFIDSSFLLVIFLRILRNVSGQLYHETPACSCFVFIQAASEQMKSPNWIYQNYI